MNIRAITENDKKEVLEISSKIWEGDDYIHLVFDDWIRDKRGKFVGIWENDVLLGFGKLTYLTPFDVWLEGLRKNQKIRIKGVGERLTKYFLQELKADKNLKSVRFSTYFGNIPSIKLNEKLGFRKIMSFSLKYLEIQKNEKIISKKLSEKFAEKPDFKTVLKFIKNSEYFQKMNGFYPKGWQFFPFSEEIIREAFRQNRIIFSAKNEVIDGVLILELTNYEGVEWIGFLEADNSETFSSLLRRAKNRAIQNEKNELQMVLPDASKLLHFCAQSGFESWERDNDVFLYEFPFGSTPLSITANSAFNS